MRNQHSFVLPLYRRHLPWSVAFCTASLNATSTRNALGYRAMIDNFSLALSHGLILLVAYRLFMRSDLDQELPAVSQAPADPQPAPRRRTRR